MSANHPTYRIPEQIEAIVPRGWGHQFLFYGDACSGVPDAVHEETFAGVNAVAARLAPAPEFVVFAGDEIVGLTADETELREQWRHWFDVEMAWLDRSSIALYNTTSNHTTYDAMSERVFADVLAHLPRNGPPGQEGLSYFVRRADLLLIFVHTSWSGLGGEGHVETDWLDEILDRHADAGFKLVVGHHPVFPVNGFSGEYQREIGAANGATLWEVLVRNGVQAYLCSHILAFDVQVHDGVLQIVSAGAGTAHRMPVETEYLHLVQAAVDDQGLRYQVLDQSGVIRERLAWPPTLKPSSGWEPLTETTAGGVMGLPPRADPDGSVIVALRLTGTTSSDGDGRPQSLLAARQRTTGLPTLWIGLTGTDQRLTVTITPQPGRSPHYWFGPNLEPGQPFDFQIALHTAMGPGGVLHRAEDGSPWSSLTSSSPWGLERLTWPTRWTVGSIDEQAPTADFRGVDLTVSHADEVMTGI